MEPVDIKDAAKGRVYLAWIDGTQLPNYRLVSKTSRKKWEIEGGDQKIPEAWIGCLWQLPDPPVFIRGHLT